VCICQRGDTGPALFVRHAVEREAGTEVWGDGCGDVERFRITTRVCDVVQLQLAVRDAPQGIAVEPHDAGLIAARREVRGHAASVFKGDTTLPALQRQ